MRNAEHRTTVLEIEHPERYWNAARTDMPWLADPDCEDGRARHTDKSEIRWSIVGKIVEYLGKELGRNTNAAVPCSGGCTITLSVPEGFHLSGSELQIIKSWFGNGLAPQADPWDTSVSNGRHRLWNVWQAQPAAVLPVISDLLPWQDSVHDSPQGFEHALYLSAKIGVLKTPADSLLRKNSSHYFQQLEYNASRFPETPEAQEKLNEIMVLRDEQGL